MRYAVISDIHGNLEALQAALRYLDSERIDEYICVGDIVGYGANPNECVEIIRGLTDKVVVGNHDHAAIGLTDISYFNPYARQAVLWTGQVLTPQNRDYLARLPFILELEQELIVHASPNRPQDWGYILSIFDAIVAFKHMESQWQHLPLCFIGHSHQPIVLEKKEDSCRPIWDDFFEVDGSHRYIINVGSVGQPRDGNPRLCYCIYDTEEQTVSIKRAMYDVATAQEKIRRAGLPEILAYRLALGQ